jgi:peroxiredoxin
MGNGFSIGKWNFLMPWFLVTLMAISQIFLIGQNLQMRKEIERRTPDTLSQGQVVAPFSAKTLEGDVLTVKFAQTEPSRVLLYFSPECGYCQGQFAFWRELMKKVDRRQFVFIGIVSEAESQSNLRKYLSLVDCSEFPVAFISLKTANDYKLSITPTTLLINGDGKVEQAWVGRWNADIYATARLKFGI